MLPLPTFSDGSGTLITFIILSVALLNSKYAGKCYTPMQCSLSGGSTSLSVTWMSSARLWLVWKFLRHPFTATSTLHPIGGSERRTSKKAESCSSSLGPVRSRGFDYAYCYHLKRHGRCNRGHGRQ